MKLGQAKYGGTTYSVIMDDRIYEILLTSKIPDIPLERDGKADEIAERVVKWIESGEPFSYPLHERGTPFQQKIYNAIQKIPRGKVSTYKAVAQKVGARSCRAVGQALGANPIPLLVPCHRIIGSDGRLTGFGGGIDLKRKILEAEGVEFCKGKVKREYILDRL